MQPLEAERIATDPVRAFAFGSLAGLVLTACWFIGFILLGMWTDEPDFTFGQWLVYGFLAVSGAVMAVAIAFPFAGFAAAICLSLMLWIERQINAIPPYPFWCVAGGICALPIAWLFSIFHGLASPLGIWIIACGVIGGAAARFGYTYKT